MSMKTPTRRSQGAELTDEGVHYRTWCKHDRADVLILDAKGHTLRAVPLQANGDGYFSALDAAGRAGDLYQYRFGDSQGWPDPASRWQPHGVHGASMVIDPAAYKWRDENWSAPPFSELVIYEVHLGTFTPGGTFRSAIERLDHLVSLGVNALELMPVADFPGERNWGYDGVMLYAPARCYGHPDDMRALVEAAHARGLAVILDVVYNHFGPDGNYVSVYHGDYFEPEAQTPWGAALNYAAPAVRAFFLENAPYWRREFHIDGFRLDATHEIADKSARHLLAEIAAEVHSLGGFVLAEDERNEPELLRSPEAGGFGLDGVWSDDFHHVIHVALTGEREGYYENFNGTPQELAETLTHGWLFRGQKQRSTGEPRGGDSAGLSPEQFVFCISNHDQVGNRALGERLGHLISPAAYRAVSALLCLIPQMPLIFQGQEWSASTPFQFFTDHNPELGRLVTEGRRREFQKFAAFRDPAMRETIPDPQAAGTFRNSKLRWAELEQPEHAGVHLLYRECLALRQAHPAWRSQRGQPVRAVALTDGAVGYCVGSGAGQCLVLSNLSGGSIGAEHADLAPPSDRVWQIRLSSNEARFGGEATTGPKMPTTLVLEAV